MSLDLVGVENIGDLERERVVLKAKTEVDIGRYAIFAARIMPNGVASGPVNSAYWFQDKKVKAGDFVVLYSKNGDTSEKANEQGVVSHFFYWRKTTPLWTKEVAPVVVNTPSWTMTPKK